MEGIAGWSGMPSEETFRGRGGQKNGCGYDLETSLRARSRLKGRLAGKPTTMYQVHPDAWNIPPAGGTSPRP